MKRTIILILALFMTACQSSQGESPSTEASSTPMDQLSIGDQAPEVVATNQDGELVDFSSLYKEGPVLVYFYPKADTPGCTAQACSIRDSYQQLSDSGLKVVGVSLDSAQDQKAFQKKYNLPFLLISDTEEKVVNAFKVKALAGMANREAFLVKDGKIAWHDDTASTEKQAEDVLTEIGTWKSE